MSFKFVSAAVNPKKDAGLGVYITYKGANKYTDEIVLREYTPARIWLDCPDRELLLVNDSHMTDPFVPLGESYDEYVDLNVFEPTAKHQMGFEYLMLNYPQHLEQKYSPNMRLKEREEGAVNYIADSGGFQLMTGQLRFLDPVQIVQWYNTNVDIGLVLDVPLFDSDDDLVRRSAKIQKMNTDIMMEHKRDSLDLMNIFHGVSINHKRMYREIVEDDRIDRLALGGEYYNNVVSGTNNMLTMLEEAKNYKHIHVLGVYNLHHLACLIRAANYKNTKTLITSDASTHIQSAVKKTYHLNRGQQYTQKRLHIGDNSRFPSIQSQTSCPCKACQAIKYMDVFGVLGGLISAFALAYHNVYEIHRYVNMLTEVSKDVNDLEFMSILRGRKASEVGIVSKKAKIMSRMKKKEDPMADVSMAIGFIGHAEKHGLADARVKYGNFIKHGLGIENKDMASEAGLFRRKKESTTFDEESEQNEEVIERFHNIQGILNRYDGYHGSEKGAKDWAKRHGEKVEERDVTTRGSSRQAEKAKSGGKDTALKADKQKRKRMEKSDAEQAKLYKAQMAQVIEYKGQPRLRGEVLKEMKKFKIDPVKTKIFMKKARKSTAKPLSFNELNMPEHFSRKRTARQSLTS